MKRCPKCGGLKPVDAFSRNKRRPDGLDVHCRMCIRERLQRKKARYVAAGGCADCGKIRSRDNNLYCERCSLMRAAQRRKRDVTVRAAALRRYSAGEVKCACCNETHLEFLTLDHVNNDGKTHRLRSKTAHGVYRDLRRNGFPAVMQVLCFNCNMARAALGVCPHRGAPPVREDAMRRLNDLSDPDGTKRCSVCGLLAPRRAFYRDPGTLDGLQSRCGVCTRKAARERLQRIKREAL